MKNKFIVIAVFILLGLAYFFLKDSGQAVKSSLDTAQMTADRRTFENAEATEVQTYEALARMARAQDQQTLEVALKKAADSSRIVREGAANALGHYANDEAFLALAQLLKDEDLNIRIRTLQALGNAKENRRIELMHEFLKNDPISSREKFVAHSVLLKLASQEAEKKYSMDFFIEFINSGDGSEQLMAFSKLAEIAPHDSQTLELIRGRVEASKNPEIVALGIRHLATLKDQWLGGRLPALLENSNEAVRAAAVASLHQFCLKNTWDILQSKLKSDKSSVVLGSIVREAVSLGGEKSKSFMQKIIDSGYLKGDQLLQAKELKKTLPAVSTTCPQL